MSNLPICPCDGALPAPPTNLPGLSHIGFRVGTFSEFRRALLTPIAGETELSTGTGNPAWRPGASGDLAVMMVEWWAYIADVLTFYNERIANQDYLRTADLPESVPRLIRLLGYRPRPAIGATGALAALVTPGQTSKLPKGLPFQSKPGPGQEAQTFELDVDSVIGAPDAVPATPPPSLFVPAAQPPVAIGAPQVAALGPVGVAPGETLNQTAIAEQTLAAFFGFPYWPFPYPPPPFAPTPFFDVLLNGVVPNVDAGALLLLVARNPNAFTPLLASVSGQEVVSVAGGGKRTKLTLFFGGGSPPGGLMAGQARLQKAGTTGSLWSFFPDGVISGNQVQLAGLSRQLRPGDPVAFVSAAATVVTSVVATSDVTWFSNAAPSSPTVAPNVPVPLPVPHTQLTVNASFDDGLDPTTVTVLSGWVDVGQLVDQPPSAFTGNPATLLAVSPAQFASGTNRPILIADATGVGVASGGSSSGGNTLTVSGPLPPLQSPLSVLYNLLPISRGKTVANEVLGSGNAAIASQTFPLAKSPVTYLSQGTGFVSTVTLRVDGRPWTEVPTLFNQAPNAEVFITREDEAGQTHVDFGDGVNGSRLTTGTNNVVATYRVGAGAASPAAGKLTVIGQSFPGLRSVLNPVAVSGGEDAEPPTRIAQFAPRSVLAFGRAVSVFDYQAIALQAPGVARAQVVWAWNDAEQRTVVTVFVGDDAAAAAAARSVLAGAGDPNRPVTVVPATALPTTLELTVIITPGFDADVVTAGIESALADPTAGLFAASNLQVGQTVFTSQIEQAVLGVAGTVAISGFAMFVNGAFDGGSIHSPGEGAFYGPASVLVFTQVDSHG